MQFAETLFGRGSDQPYPPLPEIPSSNQSAAKLETRMPSPSNRRLDISVLRASAD